MLVIPAIDIRCGQFVHLMSMPQDQELANENDPLQVALWWEEQGAKMLQITDLDGSFTGMPENLKTIKRIVEQVKIPLQVAGGLRTFDNIQNVLDLGVFRVIMGTSAIRETNLIKRVCSSFGERVGIGIDSRDGLVTIEGWHQPTKWTVLGMCQHLHQLGVSRVVINDTRRYGSLKGPDFNLVQEIVENVGLKLILAGGIASVQDLEKLKKLVPQGVEGVIVGKALYYGLINL